MSPPTPTRLAPLALSTLLAACGGHGGKPAASATPAAAITPDPAPTAGPAPADVLAALATGGSPDRICFAWARNGSVMCSIDVSSIQDGAAMSVRVLGPDAAEFTYYLHPRDQQYLEMDVTVIDHASLDSARTVAAALDMVGWGGPDVEIEPGGTVVVGNHTVRRIRTETGSDGDPETGVWTTSTDVLELRCDERWVPIELVSAIFGNPIEPPTVAAVALGDRLLLTAAVHWGIEGDHGGGTDAALIDPTTVCK